ncbi:multiubiquitin domain-containing protein [Draconibacterium orientale]|uniref:multiubiquitin domain-containing protein n=1 Tax=Draconibacterium orientale TaxID=1168034 RepID=UPI0029C0F88E|nr:multiubiquitin domain-containing protein [Draconibacterium orientale]
MKDNFIIIVNGREKEWNDKTISFEQVVILAFGTYQNNGRTAYTVTYTRGNNDKPQGSMVAGDTVKVKQKMIFNVTATDKS